MTKSKKGKINGIQKANRLDNLPMKKKKNKKKRGY
jgi:hypothetical protein